MKHKHIRAYTVEPPLGNDQSRHAAPSRPWPVLPLLCLAVGLLWGYALAQWFASWGGTP